MIGVYWKYWKIIGTNCYSPTVGTWWVPGKKGSPGHRGYLLGGDWNMAGLWLSIWEWLGMSFDPNCYSLRFFRGVGWNHQPVIYFVSLGFFGYFGRLFVLSCYTNLQRPGDQWILPTSMFKKKQVPAIPAIYQLYTSYTPAIYQLLVTLLTLKKHRDSSLFQGLISVRGKVASVLEELNS